MKTIKTEIIIEASAEKVWNIFSDFSEYGKWNPFIIAISGNKEVGSALKVTLQLEGKKPMEMKPVVQECIEKQKFEWLGKLPLGMFNGRHYFIIEEVSANQIKFTQGEYFTGWLSGMIMKQISENTRNGFIRMNRALKEQCEK